ncbi:MULTISPECIES: hypothetical protein [unclassified Bradyrhizobium]|uniref:hypothetical protein n=1 Tax=unclassified Bradyrhizobium TaxID=2631580 RepID=UPI003397F21D
MSTEKRYTVVEMTVKAFAIVEEYITDDGRKRQGERVDLVLSRPDADDKCDKLNSDLD